MARQLSARWSSSAGHPWPRIAFITVMIGLIIVLNILIITAPMVDTTTMMIFLALGGMNVQGH